MTRDFFRAFIVTLGALAALGIVWLIANAAFGYAVWSILDLMEAAS